MKSRALSATARIYSCSARFCRPIFTKPQNNVILAPTNNNVVNDLINIFTKNPICTNNSELDSLAPLLSTKIVETVLTGFKNWKTAYMFFDWASNQYGYKHNIYTYNAMASILSSARQNAPLRDLATNVVESRCFMSPGALGFLIRCLGSVGLVEEANLLFDQVKEKGLCVPNGYSYNCLLDAISRSSSIDLADMRLKEMRDYGFDCGKYTLTPLLQVYCTAGEFDKALDVYKQIQDQGWLDAHVFSILLLYFCKWGEVDKAFKLIERMDGHGIRLNEKTFATMINLLVRESRTDKALQFFNEIRKSGFTPNVSLYYVFIEELCKTKEVVKAFHLYSEMKELGIQIDVGITRKLLSSFSEEGDLIQMLRESWEHMDEEVRTLLCNRILDIFVSKGTIDKAYDLLLEMMGREVTSDIKLRSVLSNKEVAVPNTTSFIIVIDGLLKCGKLDVALNLFQDMVRIGYKPNLVLYNNLIFGLCNSNRLEESYELLREMKESRFEPTQFTHNSIFGCLCQRRDVMGAIALLREMRVFGHEPWIKNSTLLVKNLCNNRQVMEACKFLDTMAQEGFPPDIIAYSAAMDGLIRINKLDGALEIFQELSTRGFCPDVVAHNIIINGLCRAKRVAEAQNLLNEMLMKGVVPSVATYNLLIDGWCKNDGIDQAMLWFSRMCESEREPNVISYTTLISGLCTARRPDDALMLLNQMGGRKCAPNRIAYQALVHGLCKCGRTDEALVHFYHMKEKKMKSDTYVYIGFISAFITNSNLAMALEMLKQMVDGGSFPDPADNNYPILRDAIYKLLEDSRTSSCIRKLIEENSSLQITLSDVGREGGFEPIV
ncbi:putative pentatricopeptide repeat-containing protein [Tripterygium wilfordii]|uniref:Putative pentatricopeptide repeat-containing protein n=1 Tax=Tripterygium wilfordii TaxID=458696 RepID=A0A7J7CVH3_TRIWF|nr:putative pentatricopeptide repeat-containing protein At5g08310, mitochondrial [Tripterygium wilfordii]XP_038719108.1 putative pentatricopeptide repeat-containing protein At5g08310, mitochondrial [Tripterygium wilfordii]XP_038719109.1 putative pentatricopeptide repeat-containing protein At5g08310, mitochondrial [Tripterygium wilfordii]KAF5737939.1 putative pentatricopeptide repeat-containing protein [Tripterygium wilfordii]